VWIVLPDSIKWTVRIKLSILFLSGFKYTWQISCLSAPKVQRLSPAWFPGSQPVWRVNSVLNLRLEPTRKYVCSENSYIFILPFLNKHIPPATISKESDNAMIKAIWSANVRGWSFIYSATTFLYVDKNVLFDYGSSFS